MGTPVNHRRRCRRPRAAPRAATGIQIVSRIARTSLWLAVAMGCGKTESDRVAATRPLAAVDQAATVRDSCSAFQLGGLLAVDTTALPTTRYRGPLPESTQGGIVTAYGDSAQPTVIRVDLAGEIGKSSYTFYLGEAGNYVVDYRGTTFAMPLGMEGSDSVASIVRQVFYVCHGTLVTDYFSQEARGLGRLLNVATTAIREMQ